MAGLGDIVTTLTVVANANPGLDRFERQLRRAPEVAFIAARRTGDAFQQISAGSNRGTFALLELSRAVEDASVGFSLNGLQGALRGSINNISMLATTIHPLAGVVAGLAGGALALLTTSFGDNKKAATEAKDALAKYREEIEKFNQAQSQVTGFRQRLRNLKDSDSAQGMLDENRDRLEEMQDRERFLQADRQRLSQRFQQVSMWDESDPHVAAEKQRQLNDLRNEDKAIAEELAKIEAERAAALRERIAIQERLNKLSDEEKQKKAQEQDNEFQKREQDKDREEFRRQQQKHQRGRIDRNNRRFGLIQGIAGDAGVGDMFSEFKQREEFEELFGKWDDPRKEQLRALLGEQRGGALFADVAEKGSAEDFRARFAGDALKQEDKDRQKTNDLLKDIYELLKKEREELEEEVTIA